MVKGLGLPPREPGLGNRVPEAERLGVVEAKHSPQVQSTAVLFNPRSCWGPEVTCLGAPVSSPAAKTPHLQLSVGGTRMASAGGPKLSKSVRIALFPTLLAGPQNWGTGALGWGWCQGEEAQVI